MRMTFNNNKIINITSINGTSASANYTIASGDQHTDSLGVSEIKITAGNLIDTFNNSVTGELDLPK